MQENNWKAFGFEKIITLDGSPTLKPQASLVSGQQSEEMHHSHGAFSESLYIYAEPVTAWIKDKNEISLLSVGLGLGYNEILMIATALAQGKKIQILTYESDLILKNKFKDYFFREYKENEFSSEQSENIFFDYQTILQKTASRYDLVCAKLFLEIQKALKVGHLKLMGPLSKELLIQMAESQEECCFDVILFDAYSSKTSPELWSEDFLNYFIEQQAKEACLFLSYAVTGSLKRALKTNGFSLINKKGFAGKRESTQAERK